MEYNEKECRRCNQIKHVGEFYSSSNKDGYDSYCKECRKEYQLEWTRKNAHKVTKHRKNYFRKKYADDPEFRAKNLETSKKYKEKNREKLKIKAKEYRERLKEDNPRYFADQAREYRLKDWNALKHNLRNNNYRCYKRMGRPKEEVITWQEVWDELILPFGYSCFRCGDFLDITIDHIIPLPDGKNEINNIQFLCRTCNKIKDRATTDFRGKPPVRRKLF